MLGGLRGILGVCEGLGRFEEGLKGFWGWWGSVWRVGGGLRGSERGWWGLRGFGGAGGV